MRTLQLSVEEVAFTLAQAGRPDLARGVLRGYTDADLSAENVVQRMLAASHSLLARQLLRVDEQARPVLGGDLEWMSQVFAATPFSLRYTMASSETAATLNYHAVNGSFVEHAIQQGVVHILHEHEVLEAAIKGGLDFFGIAGYQSPFAGEFELPQAFLDQVQQEGDQGLGHNLLNTAIVDESFRRAFAEDFAQPAYRGSVLRIEYGAGGEPVSDHGLLLLRGAERLWFLKPFRRDEESMVTLLPASAATFRREVAALMA